MDAARHEDTVDLAPAALDGPFLAELCHRVRTPLNGILGTLELLLAGELNDETRELVRAAYASAVGLHHVFEQEIATAQEVRPSVADA